MKNKQLITNILLISLLILENLCLYIFFKQGVWTQGKNAICLFLSSVLFGVVLMYRFHKVTISLPVPQASSKKFAYVLVPLFIAGLVWIGFQYNDFFSTHKILVSNSDIIPAIQIMCERLLDGRYPYKVITSFGFEQHVGYMPFHWMPLSLAQLLHIDPRWIPSVIWGIAALWLCIRSMRVHNTAAKILIPLLLLASNYILFDNSTSIIADTVELMIAGYYMMLMTGMNLKSAILQGVMIAFCLLSRYSIVLWLPLYAFTLYVSQQRKQLYVSVITVTVLVLLCYVIPFLSKDWSMLQGYKHYDIAARFEWNHMNKDGLPIQLFSGTGYAYYFYTRFPGMELADRIKLLQRAEIICSLLVTIIMGAWYWYNRRRIDHRIFLMGSFKIYLAVFLFLIQVPYEYLMCVGNFVTIAIFCEQLRYRIGGRSELV